MMFLRKGFRSRARTSPVLLRRAQLGVRLSSPTFYVMTIELRESHSQAWSSAWPWLVFALGVVIVVVGGVYFTPG